MSVFGRREEPCKKWQPLIGSMVQSQGAGEQPGAEKQPTLLHLDVRTSSCLQWGSCLWAFIAAGSSHSSSLLPDLQRNHKWTQLQYILMCRGKFRSLDIDLRWWWFPTGGAQGTGQDYVMPKPKGVSICPSAVKPMRNSEEHQDLAPLSNRVRN